LSNNRFLCVCVPYYVSSYSFFELPAVRVDLRCKFIILYWQYISDALWKLTLDVLLFLTLPFDEVWTETTIVWLWELFSLWRKPLVIQTSTIGAGSQSLEQLHGEASQDVHVSHSNDSNSAIESADGFRLGQVDEEHGFENGL
jgi:hypothetical protein